MLMSDSKSVRLGAKIYQGRGCSRRSMIGRAIPGHFTPTTTYYQPYAEIIVDNTEQAAGTLILGRTEDD